MDRAEKRSLSETKRGRQAGEHKGAGYGLSSLPAACPRVRHDQAVGQSLKLLKDLGSIFGLARIATPRSLPAETPG